MNREDLTSLVLLSVHEYVGGYLQALEQQLQQQGKEPEQARRQAREMAMLHFRATAQMWAGFSQQDGGEES